jgi:hypothetical protein
VPDGIFFKRFGLSWVMPSRLVDLLVGGLLVALRVLLCGRWCLTSCGAVGGKRMIEILRTARGCLRNLCPFSSILLYLWAAAFISPLVLGYQLITIFLFFFLLAS